jgi:hypothetical protein
MKDRVGDRFGDGEPDVAEAAVDDPYTLGIRGDLGTEDGDLLGSCRDFPPCWLGRHAARCAHLPGVHAPVCSETERSDYPSKATNATGASVSSLLAWSPRAERV